MSPLKFNVNINLNKLAKNFALLGLATSLFVQSFAFADGTNVSSTRVIKSSNNYETSVVRVTTSTTTSGLMFKFDFCTDETFRSCKAIGNSNGYTEEQLKTVRRNKRLKAAGIAVVDVVLVLAAGWAGGAGAAIVYSASEAGAIMMPIGFLGGLGVGSAIVSFFEFFSPIARLNQANTLAQKKLNTLKQGDVVIDVPVSEYAEKLGLLLEEVN